MKLKIDEDSNNPDIVSSVTRNQVSLPQGLFGFSEIRGMELVFDEEELPFMWLREINRMVWHLSFGVRGIVLFCRNCRCRCTGSWYHWLKDTMILNIVTLPPIGKISLNLVGL